MYEFTLILSGVDELPDELPNQLFEAGCKDCTPTSSGGVVRIHFDREAESLEQAIKSAIQQVSSVGCEVATVEIEACRVAQ